LDTQYAIAVRINYIIKEESIENQINDVKKLLLGFRNYLDGKIGSEK
jgi:hypothetical protein